MLVLKNYSTSYPNKTPYKTRKNYKKINKINFKFFSLVDFLKEKYIYID